MKAVVYKLYFALFAIVFTIALGIGCATLDKGADPLIVRAEQVETVAASTFDLILQLDHSRRDFYREKAPEFHAVAEWLRQPQNVGGTNYPRAIALVLNVNAVKSAYRQNHSNSNLLASSLSVIESAIRQASDALKTQQPK